MKELEKIIRETTVYKKLYNNNYKITSANDLIPINKKVLNELKLEKNNCKVYSKGKTSGSTGHPFEMVFDRSILRPLNWLSQKLRKEGVKPWKRTLLIWREKHLSTTQKLKIRIGLLKIIRIESFESDLLHIKNFKPFIIKGYASYIHRLYLKNHPLTNQVKIIIPVAEGLTEDQYKMIQAKGGKLINYYGGTEAPAIAIKINDSKWEINPFYKLSVVEKNENTFELLITNLKNRCLPMIAYKIGDVVKEIERDENGWLISFKELVGRKEDFLTSQDNKQIPPQLIRNLFTKNHKEEFQCYQENKGILLLFTDSEPNANLIEELKKLGINKIEVQPYSNRKINSSLKEKIIINDCT